MTTTYTTRTKPTTSYTTRTPVVSYDYYTWNEVPFTWNTTPFTWDTAYSGFVEWTQYTTRPII